jgi:hypothetical protein
MDFQQNFTKSFGASQKTDLMAMFEDFHKGDLTISNFNFGIVCTGSLIRAA